MHSLFGILLQRRFVSYPLFLNLFTLVWTHGFLLILSTRIQSHIVYLLHKLLQHSSLKTFPSGSAVPVIVLQCYILLCLFSLEHFPIWALQNAPHSSRVYQFPAFEKPFLQRALVPFIGEEYLESTYGCCMCLLSLGCYCL